MVPIPVVDVPYSEQAGFILGATIAPIKEDVKKVMLFINEVHTAFYESMYNWSTIVNIW